MSIIATHHQINVQGLPTHFVRMGKGTKPVIFLHGWGGSANSFFSLASELATKRPELDLILVDYPGFGMTQFPEGAAWDTYRYAEWVYDFMTTLNIPQADFYIHSFGGRIITRLCERHPSVVSKMILTGAAGIKWPLSARQKISVKLSQIMPKFNSGLLRRVQKFAVTKIFGARDWGNVSPILKPTLQTVLAEEDILEKLTAISNQTLILWGGKDRITPLKSGNVFAQKLPNNQMKVFPKGRHGIHHTHRAQIVEALVKFL